MSDTSERRFRLTVMDAEFVNDENGRVQALAEKYEGHGEFNTEGDVRRIDSGPVSLGVRKVDLIAGRRLLENLGPVDNGKGHGVVPSDSSRTRCLALKLDRSQVNVDLKIQGQ